MVTHGDSRTPSVASIFGTVHRSPSAAHRRPSSLPIIATTARYGIATAAHY